MTAEEREKVNASISELGPGYPPITDDTRDWGRGRNAKCLVRGHDFLDPDDPLCGEIDVCARCGYKTAEAS